MTRTILALCGKPESLIRYVTDRLGHDRRYAINCAKAESELGWRPTVTFEKGLADTVAWYQTHAAWIERVRSGAYRTAVRSEVHCNDRERRGIAPCVRW